jgi:hypothetical protein
MHSWEDNIEVNLTEIVHEYMNWIQLAPYRFSVGRFIYRGGN